MRNRYWLSLGPITDRERARAFKAIPRGERTRSRIQTFVAKLRKRRHLNRYLRGKQAAATDPSRPWDLVFGETRVGGIVSLMHASGTSTQKNLYLHVVVTIAAHEINHIKKVYFDGYEVTWGTDLTTRPTGQVNATGLFANLVRMQVNYGTDGQAALSVPVGDTGGVNPVSAKWTTSHRQRGHAHVYFRFTYNEEVFRSGVPEIEFLISGHAALIDPRTGSTAAAGSANPAVILYSYMRNTRFGMGIPSTEFNATRWSDAANTCDQNISLAGGGSEARYRFNGLFSTEESPGAIIEGILATMAGRLTYTEGKWSLWAGEGRTPVLTITEDMVLSEIVVVSKTPRVDSFNSVRGNHNSVSAGYDEADFPEVSNALYVTQDGGEKVYEDLTFEHVTSPVTCQRLSKIELESVRQGIVVEFTAALNAYRAEPGEWVSLTISRFGWTAKSFEVMRSVLQIDEDDQGSPVLNVRLTLRETAAGVFAWNQGEETAVDLAPDTNLPDPFSAPAPTNITLASGTAHLYVRSDGTVFSRLFVQWTMANDAFVQNGGYYDIQYKLTSSVTWQDAGDIPGSSDNFYILDVRDSLSYDVRIRSVSSLGTRSAWATATGHVVIGKTQAPSNVSNLSSTISSSGVRLEWSPVSDLDVREYEIRYGAASSTWATALANGSVRVRATSFTYPTFRTGEWRFFVKAVDTSGNESVETATILLSVPAPSAVRNLTAEQVETTILLNWEEPSSSLFPITHYEVFRQENVVSTNTAEVKRIGKVDGTFTTFSEIVSGTYVYLVTPIDIAGNRGATAQTSLFVYPPRDFVLRSTDTLDLSAAGLTNAVYVPGPVTVDTVANSTETWAQHFLNNNATTIQQLINAGYVYWLEPLTSASGTVAVTLTDGLIWMPFDTTTTWDEHFTDNQATSIQDLINAGYTNWLVPSSPGGLTWEALFALYNASNMQELYDAGIDSLGITGNRYSGVASLDYDRGEVLSQSVVSFDYQLVGSGLRPTPVIGWRKTTSDTWTYGPAGKTRVVANDFRYLRLYLIVNSETKTDWCAVGDVSYRITVREISDGGTVQVYAADSGGTTVNFNRSFLDVSSLVVSAQGSTELKAVRDFTDVPNPTSFKALLFNAAGARVDGAISWSARGIQAVI